MLAVKDVVVDRVGPAEQGVGAADDVQLRGHVGQARGAVQAVAVARFDQERPRGDQRGDVPHVHRLVQVGHIVACAVLVPVQERLLVPVHEPADHGAAHPLVQRRGPQRLQPPARQPGDPQACRVAVGARLDIVDQAVQVPGPHAGHRLAQGNGHVVDPQAGGSQQVPLRGPLLALAKATGVGAKDGEPLADELHAIVIVVLVDGPLEIGVQAHAGHGVLAPRPVPVRRDHHRVGGLAPLGQQGVQGHDHARLGGDLDALAHVGAHVLLTGHLRVGRGADHGVVAADLPQDGARFLPPDLPVGHARARKGLLAAHARPAFAQVGLGHQAHAALVAR